MKRIAVIAFYKDIGEFYKRHIQEIFGELVNVECYYIENNLEEADLEADLIVVSSNIIFEHIKNINKKNIDTIIIKRTFTKSGFEKIKAIREEGEILFVSTFYELAVESIAQLYELGVQELKFVPYNPLFQKEQENGIKIAVTAGEAERVPPYVEKIIDVGDRVLDISTIADIGVRLNISSDRMNNLIESYKNDLIVTNSGLKRIMDEAKTLKDQMNTILGFVTDSIIAVNTESVITEYNEVSESIFGIEKTLAIGREVKDFFAQQTIKDSHNKKRINPWVTFFEKSPVEEIQANLVVYVNGMAVVISKYPLKQEGRVIGMVFVTKKYIEVVNEHNRLRSKLIPIGHVAKYTFEHVLGKSKNLDHLKTIAKKMSDSGSTVLITGESGTGKEVFAQAIHNESRRREKPFIAVNCSAITANLLESELFGYEEGAFTGAKKGGKVGLFELANGGTIFLDEIGELPYEMQAKLLRVLMERDIMRVGGTDVIHIDVRVIAATNKNLQKLIADGNFREDLYYRLNVLPLHLPPLRERREDILILAESFFEEFGSAKHLTTKAQNRLKLYAWPGNIRELKNCMEYMYQMSEEICDEKDLPEYIRWALESAGDGEQNHKLAEVKPIEQEILKILKQMEGNGVRAGRKIICEELRKRGKKISEQETRFLIKELEVKGLVSVGKGKQGCCLKS